MITFNVQAHNGNYYRGHKPSNISTNCWAGCYEEEHALVLTIEQARRLVRAWGGFLKIVVSVSVVPMSDEAFQHELFCALGGSWYEYARPHDPPCDCSCSDCEARRKLHE